MSFMIERFRDEKARFNTFLVDSVRLEKAQELARNGFINWSDEESAQALCVFCSTYLVKVKADSDIVKLHFKKSRDCPVYRKLKYFSNYPQEGDLFLADTIRYENLGKTTRKRRRGKAPKDHLHHEKLFKKRGKKQEKLKLQNEETIKTI